GFTPCLSRRRPCGASPALLAGVSMSCLPVRSRRRLLAMWLIAACPRVASAEDWAQFRGPNCSGISPGTATLPTKFSATENVRWSADVGEGVGCAAVAAGRVFVGGMTKPDTVSLFGFDEATGKLLWRRDWIVGDLPEIHHTN